MPMKVLEQITINRGRIVLLLKYKNGGCGNEENSKDSSNYSCG